jgi:hypothetical protein
MVSWLIFDLDHDNPLIWEEAGLPAPNLAVRNRTTGHSHLFYAIAPVCTTEAARPKPIEYMKAVYAAMAARLNADTQFHSGPVAKTPGHPWWDTWELHAHQYELGTLADYVELPAPFPQDARPAENHAPHSRHCQLFELLRHYAYSIVGKLKAAGGYEQFVALLEAFSLNAMGRVVRAAGSAEGELRWSSIRATVRSVARWTWEHYRGAGGVHRGVMGLDEAMPLPERQHLAALRTHELRTASTESRIRAACRNLQAQGKPLVQALVAKAAQLSRQTVAAYRHVFREVAAAVDVVMPLRPAPAAAGSDVKYAVHQVAAAPAAWALASLRCCFGERAFVSAGLGVASEGPGRLLDASSRKSLVGNSPELSIRDAQGAQRPESTASRSALPSSSYSSGHPVRAGRSFAPATLERLRGLPLRTALDRLGLYVARDRDFSPAKDRRTERWIVSVGGGAFELVVTGVKWFDAQAGRGGAGAIDLAMHLLRLDFAAAVKKLSATRRRPRRGRDAACPQILGTSLWSQPLPRRRRSLCVRCPFDGQPSAVLRQAGALIGAGQAGLGLSWGAAPDPALAVRQPVGMKRHPHQLPAVWCACARVKGTVE